MWRRGTGLKEREKEKERETHVLKKTKMEMGGEYSMGTGGEGGGE